MKQDNKTGPKIMELPAKLRSAAEDLLTHITLSDLTKASQRLTRRYRAELRDGKLHLDSALAAKAYIAARLPATYAAVYQALVKATEFLPDFTPKTLLDAGAGPATASFAAQAVFPSLVNVVLCEQSQDIAMIGQQLCRETADFHADWRAVDLTKSSKTTVLPRSDLVILAYVLDELANHEQDQLVSQLWQKTDGLLILVEPGTPAGWQRLMRQRSLLQEQGAFIAAPCPHAALCPLVAINEEASTVNNNRQWCHFSVRVARSHIHRLTKQADVPWEDEKYAYIAASRITPQPYAARIIGTPHRASGRISLKLCESNGTASDRQISRRDGDSYKTARRSDWGDVISD